MRFAEGMVSSSASSRGGGSSASSSSAGSRSMKRSSTSRWSNQADGNAGGRTVRLHIEPGGLHNYCLLPIPSMAGHVDVAAGYIVQALEEGAW